MLLISFVLLYRTVSNIGKEGRVLVKIEKDDEFVLIFSPKIVNHDVPIKIWNFSSVSKSLLFVDRNKLESNVRSLIIAFTDNCNWRIAVDLLFQERWIMEVYFLNDFWFCWCERSLKIFCWDWKIGQLFMICRLATLFKYAKKFSFFKEEADELKKYMTPPYPLLELDLKRLRRNILMTL